MSEPFVFTLDELLLETLRQPTATPDGVRVGELAGRLGLGETRVRELLRPLVDAGTVEHCRVPLRRIDGVWTKVAAYRLVSGEVSRLRKAISLP